MRRVFVIGFALIIQGRAVALASDLQKPASSSVTFPFDGANSLIAIDASINQKGPYRFVIDTGSSEHMISREVANTLGLKSTGTARVDVGLEEMSNAEQTNIAELRIGELTLRNQRFFIAPLPKSYPFQGILGAELFKQFVVTIDFEHSFVTFISADRFIYRGLGSRISIKLRNGWMPRVHAEVDGHSGSFKIDTGYNGSLALFA